MLDETIIPETPPRYACYGRIGEQVRVPITGNRGKRILHGVMNVWSGEVLVLITNEWVQETPQYFLRMIRSHWRGWQIVLFEDRGSPHTADDSLALASDLAIELRFLPTAAAKLTPLGFARFAAHGFSPFLFQGSKTTARLMAKTRQHLKPLLRFLKSSVLAIKLLLLELLDTP